jgi:hypothetical protein
VVSCSSSPPVTFTAQTTTLDDGAFTITTARAQATVITQSAAEFDLAHSDLGAPVGRSSRSSSATSQ